MDGRKKFFFLWLFSRSHFMHLSNLAKAIFREHKNIINCRRNEIRGMENYSKHFLFHTQIPHIFYTKYVLYVYYKTNLLLDFPFFFVLEMQSRSIRCFYVN